ncbi:general stress protein [Lederbergia lenta]|uniref:Membrane protein n=1 Tax=Lederbergia lenta TaxID=1467 RepID=A0A2X4Z891_LEDLE|nr:general stress protein [Lederbergia lenta]MCM3110310.1 general stress protein [Lederbergia lenta]MEC2324122.1 general stress protein [Lederbergia lenta]SQI60575.1 membrane protein [Lederbergia lenta]
MENRYIVGTYETEQDAIDAIGRLKNEGFRSEDISIISKNRDNTDYITEETDTHVVEGTATGVATGGLLGGLGGVLTGLGALTIPGLGAIVAAGPIIAGLTGAAAGAGIGGLAGALIGMGIPEDEAELYNEYVNEGKILVIVDRRTKDSIL